MEFSYCLNWDFEFIHHRAYILKALKIAILGASHQGE